MNRKYSHQDNWPPRRSENRYDYLRSEDLFSTCRLEKTSSSSCQPKLIDGIVAFIRHWRPAVLLWSIVAFCVVLPGSGPAAAADTKVQLQSIAQMTLDDDGQGLKYPSTVFFDPVMEEIFLVNGGTSRVVVYGPDFFPRQSIGIGRGVLAPMGGYVLSNGDVYICQARNVRNPRPRITVLNGAFFVDREIFLDEIPQAVNFSPRQLAINHDGIIYLAGNGNRGVLVLDKEGNFLRRVVPIDMVSNPVSIEALEQGAGEKEQLAADIEEEATEEVDSFADIPEEYRPRKSRQGGRAASAWRGLGAVRIIYVTIDSAGKLYLVSDETSKTYVYGPDERFLFAFGTKGGSPGQQSTPRALAIDEDRQQIYVVDFMRHTILTYDMAGTFLYEFGGRGFGPGWFNYPNGIAINNQGQIIVSDLFNKRIQVLRVKYLGPSPPSGDEPPAASTSEGSDADEALEQNGPMPEQPDAVIDQEQTGETPREQAAEAPREQPDSGIQVEIIEETEFSEHPGSTDAQENAPATPREQTSPADHVEGERPEALQ